MSSPSPTSFELLPPAPPAFVPQYPFDQVDGADVILRSDDGVDFYVHRAILSLVSAFFADMFSLPRPESEPNVPVVPVSETAAVLDTTLRLFYPGTELGLHIGSVEEVRQAVEVIRKYQMTRLLPVAKRLLERYHSSHPLAVYALAIEHDWRDVALAAAKKSLRQPLRVLLTNAPPELKGVSAIAYHNLLQFHASCAQGARSSLTNLEWFSWPDQSFDSCQCMTTNILTNATTSRRVAAWFATYLTQMRELLTITPGANICDVRSPGDFRTALEERKCRYCNQFDFLAFAIVQLPAQLKNEFDKIALKF